MPLAIWEALKMFWTSLPLNSKILSNIIDNDFYRGKTVKGCPFILTMKILRPFIPILDYTDKTFTIKFAEQI